MMIDNPLARALVVRAVSRAEPEHTRGAALAVLRANVLTGMDHADHPAADNANAVHDEIMAVRIADMPPPTDLVAILIETLAQRIGGVSHAMAWQSIGITPSRGREFLSRNAHAVDWPIWFTLREAALIIDA